MRFRQLFFIANIMAVLSVLIQGGTTQATQASSIVIFEGVFTTLWGDGFGASSGTDTKYFLTTESHETFGLVDKKGIFASAGGVSALNQKWVVGDGAWLDTGRSLQVESIALMNKGQGEVQGVYGSQPWVSILCKFSGNSAAPRDINYFTGMYSSQYPGLDHFWRQNSYNLVNLQGSGAFGWYVLPHAREYYLPGGHLDFGTAATDCTNAANPTVNFSQYVGINLMFNADLDGYAWGGGWYLCLDGVCKTWRMTWEPPWGYENIGVIAHETGHGFTLPHSEGNCQQVYDNRWDVMSDLWSNGSDPSYGTMGQHTISYHKDFLGWLTSSQVFTAMPGTVATITLEKLALPQTSNFLEAVIPIEGNANHFYTLEVRQPSSDPVDYDKWLPGFAVIIHEVTEGQSEPAVLIDQDGDCNTADAGAMYTAGEMFTDPLHGISVSILYSTSTGYVVTINNRFVNMQSVEIYGAEYGMIGESIPFTATVSPMNATTPITYTWEATGLASVIHSSDTHDTVDFSWNVEGTQTITVTASHPGGTRIDTHSVEVMDSTTLAEVEISGPTMGYVHDTYTFTASAFPVSTLLPLTYVWSVDGEERVTHTTGVTDTLSLSWDTPGLHQLSVTTTNTTGSVADVWGITVYTRFFMPIALKN